MGTVMLDALDSLGPEARAAALAALDEISRPLTVREIEHALQRLDRLSRSQRRILIAALRDVAIIAVIAEPKGGG